MIASKWPVLAAVLLTAPARADVAVRPPPREVTPRLRFEGLSEHKGFDFYLKYGRAGGNPYAGVQVRRLTSDGTVALDGQGERITEVLLVAVPRGGPAPPAEFDGTPTDKDRSGAIWSAPLPGISSGATIEESVDGVVLPYRVRLDGGKLLAEPLPAEPAPGTSTRRRDLLWPVVAGCGLAALAGFGILLWRRHIPASSPGQASAR